MYHSIERLISIRMRMVTMQNQLNACYRSLVKQILDEQLEPEDAKYYVSGCAQPRPLPSVVQAEPEIVSAGV